MLKRLTIKRLWLLTLFGSLSVVAVIAHVVGITSLLNVNDGNVAKIGETNYSTLQAAFDAASDGDVITLLSNLTQDDGVTFNRSGVSAKLDLKSYTFTVNKGSNVNSRAIRIDNGTLEVYGGSIVAVGAGTNSSNGTGCYGAFRVEANGELIAHDLTLSNARPYGLNVKVLGGKAELTNVTINSSYGGGIEVTEADLGTNSKAGKATLTGCTFTQTGYFDHCSTALSVSGGSELVINSGTYSGEHALYVFSSGGVITVNGGTFVGRGNNNRAAIVAAIDTNTYPQYTGGLQLKGGNYTGTYQITSPAYMEITGGTYTTDPTDYVPTAEGYSVVENSGSWTVQANPVVTFLLRDEVGDMTIQYNSSVYTMHTQDGVQRSGAAVYNYMTQTVTAGGTATEPTGEPSYWYHSGKTFPVGNNTGISFSVEQSQAYVFDGWRLSGTNERYDFSTPVTSDITLVPHFSAVEAVFEIYTEADLFAFAREVALGRSYRSKWGGFPRQTVKLMNNITLTSDWTPIPGNFRGIFDGNGYAISGLVINDTNNETGFFRTSGNGGNSFEVKNLTFQSPSVTSSGCHVGVLAGKMDGATVTNVTINNPTVQCTSTDNVGGLVGSVNNNVDDNQASASIFSGCSVNGGTISCTGTDGRMVGGLIGQAVRYITVTNCSVSNVTINGYRKLGGLIGQANGTHLTCTDASVSGVTLNALGDESYAKDLTMGGFVGQFATPTQSTITGTVSDITMTGPKSIASGKNYIMGLVSGGTAGTVEAAESAMSGANMTFDVTISGNNTCTVPNESTYEGIRGVPPVAKIGDVKYPTLAAAIAAVPTNGTATTITMLADDAMTAGVTVAANKNVVLELNGKTISETLTQSGTSALITNNGTLTIQDNTDTNKNGSGQGKITYANANPDTQSVPGYASNTIINQGNLTIESGYIENTTTGGYAAYTVDNLTNGGLYTPTFTMNGGKLYNSYTDAVRMFLNSTTNLNKVVINGGILNSDKTSGRVVVMHMPGTALGMGELDITGGTINGKVNAWSAANAGGVEDRFSDAQYANVSINISSGCIKEIDFSSMANETLRAQSLQVTGGVYNVSPADYVTNGYVVGDNTDEATKTNFPYAVLEAVPVAQIGETTYTSLVDAFAEVQAGQTITLLANLDFSQAPYADYKWAGSNVNPLAITVDNVTLDLNNHTISNMGNCALGIGSIYAKDGTVSGVTIKNGTLNAGTTNNVVNSYVLLLGGAKNATIQNVTTNGGINACAESNVYIKDCSVNGTKYYTVCAQTGANVTISGTTYTKNTDQTVQAKAMFWIQGAGTDSDMVTTENLTGAFDASTITIESGNFTVDTTNDGKFFLTGNGYVAPVVKGGTYNIDPSNIHNTDCVADGYEAVETTANTQWKVGEVVTGELTPTQASETQATYNVTAQVKDGDEVLETKTAQSVTVAIANNNIAEGAKLSDLNMETVVAKAISEAPDNAETINVTIAVVASEPVVSGDTYTFEVHPEATVTVGSTSSTVELTNADLAQNASFTFKLDVTGKFNNGATIKVVHKSSDPTTYPDETLSATVYTENEKQWVNITTTHFSNFELSEIEPEDGMVAVNLETGTQYPSLKAAVNAANAGETIALIADDTSLSDGSELTIDKSLTITGATAANGEPLYTIYGKPTTTGTNDIFITGSGTVTLSNVKVKNFGNNSGTDGGHAPVYVSTNFTGNVTLDNVYISDFNRGGLFLYGGTFDVENCFIDCANSRSDAFTKGIEIKGNAHGTIQNTVICNMERSTTGWVTSGIEIMGNGSVVVDRCTIISDNGEHEAVNATYGIVSSRVGTHDPSGGTLHVTNTMISTTNGSISVSDSDEYGPVNNYTIIIDDCDFDNYISTWSTTSSITVNSGSYAEDVYADAGTIIITGGEFSNFAPYTDTGSIIISAGTFDTPVPLEYCAEGYIPETITPGEAYTVGGGSYVAAIESDGSYTGYTTLADAFAAVQDGETITLLADCQVTEAIVNTKNITLDLATYSISGTVAEYLLQNQGTLVINADANNPGKIYNVSTAAKGHGAVLNDATGTITINGGIFGDNDNDPTNTGTVNSGCALRNRGTATVNGGVFTTAEPDYSGSVWAYAIVSGESEVPANITINGGDIYGKHGDLCNNNGTMEINDVDTYGTANYYSIYAWKSGTTTVNGGTFVKNGHASGASFQFYADEADANIIVKDGNFTKNTTGNFAGAGHGKVEISGGTFNKQPEDAIIATGYEAKNIGQDTWTVNLGNYVAKIGTTPYETLEAAIAAATEGANEIVLLTDIDLGTNGVTIAAEKDVILDLNNHDITGTVNGKLITNNGTLTINGNGHVYNQDISAQGHDALLNNGTVTINGGTFGDSDDDQTNGNNYNRGAGLRNFGTAVLNGGKFTAGDNFLNSGWAYAIINGDGNNTPSLTINDGVTVYGANNGNIANNSGTTTINGGEFSLLGAKSAYCLYAYNGEIVAKGGTYTKGDSSTKYIFCVEVDNDNQSHPGSISIQGGEYNINNTTTTLTATPAYITVSGGTFNKQPEDAIIATGYEAKDNGDGTWTVETVKVAQIGDVKYETLEAAIAAVTTSDATTITMIANETIEGNTGVTIAANKNIVLDLNGKTITGSSTTSSPNFYFITNRGTLEITDNSEGTPGKITYSCSAATYGNEYVTLYNVGGTLTLTKGTIENTSGGLSYAVNNRSDSQATATFNLNGGRISAPNGDAALRVYQSAGTTGNYWNIVNVTGGTLDNNGIFVDEYISSNLPDGYEGNNVKVEINISGGTVNGLIDFKMRHPFGTSLNITGGDFGNAKLRVRKYTSEYKTGSTEPTAPIVHISGGKFAFSDNDPFSMVKSQEEGEWESYTKAYDVSGGVFNKDLNTFTSIKFPVGMKGVANTDEETKQAYPYTVGESDIIVGDIILIDGEDYKFALDKTVTGQITYQRSFDSNHVGVYQSWLVPFDYVITAADVQKFQFYKVNMVANSATEGSAEQVDENSVFVHIKEMGEGEILRANKPYVIKTLDGYTTGEVINFVSITGTPLHGKRIDACNSTATSVATYDFYATYEPTYSTKNHDFLYISGSGRICWSIYPWAYWIDPYRWIIKMTAKNENYAPVFGFIEDSTDGATDLRDAEFVSDDDIEGFYTLNGVKVETPSKGVYIVKYNDGRTKKVNLK